MARSQVDLLSCRSMYICSGCAGRHPKKCRKACTRLCSVVTCINQVHVPSPTCIRPIPIPDSYSTSSRHHLATDHFVRRSVNYDRPSKRSGVDPKAVCRSLCAQSSLTSLKPKKTRGSICCTTKHHRRPVSRPRLPDHYLR